MSNSHLKEKEKQIVAHILKLTFKELVEEEKKVEDNCSKNSNVDDTYFPDIFKDMFGR